MKRLIYLFAAIALVMAACTDKSQKVPEEGTSDSIVTTTEGKLQRLEMTIDSLNDRGRYFSSHTEEMRDPRNQQLMQDLVKRIKALREELQKDSLSEDNQLRLDSLSDKVSF